MTKIEDSCGCIWCDLGLEPRKAQDGTLWHDNKRGSFTCQKPINLIPREQFLADMRQATQK